MSNEDKRAAIYGLYLATDQAHIALASLKPSDKAGAEEMAVAFEEMAKTARALAAE